MKLVLKYNPELDLELKVNIKSEPNLDKSQSFRFGDSDPAFQKVQYLTGMFNCLCTPVPSGDMKEKLEETVKEKREETEKRGSEVERV